MKMILVTLLFVVLPVMFMHYMVHRTVKVTNDRRHRH